MIDQNVDDHVDLQIQYRLTWEMVELGQSHKLETKYGAEVWKRITPQDLELLDWVRSSRESFDLADIADHRASLDVQAVMGKPIRHVELQRRATLAAGDWEPI